jgi:aminocarboxymuconate-semialdehyde decarboxylase
MKGKDYIKIDIHAHIMPEHYPDLKQKFGYGGFIYLDHHKQDAARMMRDDGRFFREIQRNCWDPEWILRDMDAHGVDVMVLCTIPVLFSYWAQPEHGLEWSRFLNDHLAEVVHKYPKRFIGLGTVPMQAPELAAQELKRCIEELGLKGVEIGTNINQKNLNESEFNPFWEMASRLQAGILVHPWEMMGEADMQKYWLPWLVGMPAECSRAICSMIFGGVFDRYPELKVMFCHGGGAFPATLGRIEHGYNCRPDLCAQDVKASPRNYIRNFYVDGITHDLPTLEFLLDLMGADRIAYGTDYPFPLGDLEHGAFIEKTSHIPLDVKQQLFAGTAIDFLGLKIEDYL